MGKVQLKVVKLTISEDDEPSNKCNRIGLTNKVVVILLLATKLESKKQWVKPESIKVFTGIDWLVFGIRVERDNTSEEETEATERQKIVCAGEETGGETEVQPVQRVSPDKLVAASFLSCCQQLSSLT